MLEGEKLTQGPVNSPSKPYGEQIQLDRLKQSLPSPPQGPGGGPAGPGGPMGPGGGGAPPQLPQVRPSSPAAGTQGGPAGVPAPLLAPGQGQGTPMMMDPAMQAAQGAMTAQQRNLAILDALSQSPNVADATREWADRTKRALIAGAQ